MFEGGQAKKSGHFEGSSQFHCYWRISTLIKSSSFSSIKNVRSVSRIWGPNDKKKVAEINALQFLTNGVEINVSHN